MSSEKELREAAAEVVQAALQLVAAWGEVWAGCPEKQSGRGSKPMVPFPPSLVIFS